jgi:hypothetical protein
MAIVKYLVTGRERNVLIRHSLKNVTQQKWTVIGLSSQDLITTKSRRSRWPRGLRRGTTAARLAGCGLESGRGHVCLSVCLSLVNTRILCCQVEISASGRFLVQRTPTVCVCVCVCVCACVRERERQRGSVCACARVCHRVCSGTTRTLYT